MPPAVSKDADNLTLLRRAITASGLSARRFAEDVMVRDERTVRRWIAGDVEIPEVVLRKLRTIRRSARPLRIT